MFTVVILLCQFTKDEECIPNLIAPSRTDFENAHYCFFCSTLTRRARAERVGRRRRAGAQLARSGPNFACIQREYQTAEMKKQEINKEERGQRRDHGSALIESRLTSPSLLWSAACRMISIEEQSSYPSFTPETSARNSGKNPEPSTDERRRRNGTAS